MDRMISIVIPCYNVQDYVETALRSATEQTLDRSLYEVIAVNDASTDDTLAVLTKWSQRYPETVKVISYEENLRQGGARNAAIREACGRYICFLDADDRLRKDALETYMDIIGSTGADIITTGFEIHKGSGFDDHREAYSGHERVSPDRVLDLNDSMQEYLLTDLGFVWSSVYRKSIITDNGVWFPEHLAYEDIYWQRLIRFYADKACITDKVTHDYLIRPGSTMTTRNGSHHLDRLTCYEMLLDEYSRRDLIRPYYDVLLKDAIEAYVFNSLYMFFDIMDDIPDVYERIRTTVYRYFPDWESRYDAGDIPLVFQYLLKYLSRAKTASLQDLQTFKEAMIEKK